MPKYVNEDGLAHFYDNLQEQELVVTDNAAISTTGESDVQVNDYSNHWSSHLSPVFRQQTSSDMADTNADGEYLAPSWSTDRIVASSYDYSPFIVGMSYVNRGITYGHGGMWGANTDNSLVCSDLVSCMLRGVYWQDSKFNNGDNVFSQRASLIPLSLDSLNNPELGDSLQTRELAHLFALCGRLFSVNENVGNVKPGDVLFSSTSTNSNYLGIDHCALVLAVHPNTGYATVMQIGGGSETVYNYTTQAASTTDSTGVTMSTVDLTSPHVQYVGRPNYPNIHPEFEEISTTLLTTSDTVTATSSNVNTYLVRETKTLEGNAAYVVQIKGSIKSGATPAAVRVMCEFNGKVISGVPRRTTGTFNKQLPYFIELPLFIEAGAESMFLVRILTFAGNTTTYDIKSVKLYKVS